MVRQLLLAGLMTILVAGRAVAAPSDAVAAECEEGTFYGTVMVIDEYQGLFSLVGTGIALVVGPDVDLAELEGRAVKIEVDSDCAIRDIKILDSATESVT